jgi:hypothetical protein
MTKRGRRTSSGRKTHRDGGRSDDRHLQDLHRRGTARRVLEALASGHAIVLIADPEITDHTGADPEPFAHAA